jgi:isoquinoline 1-oxidoreductase beta subunit
MTQNSGEAKQWSRRYWVLALAGASGGLALGACRGHPRDETLPKAGVHQSGGASPTTSVEEAPPRLTSSFVRQEQPPIAGTPLNLFVEILANGRVRLTVARSEMGQGTRTAMAMLLAHELDCPWESIDLVAADGDLAYGSQNTDGSTSVREQFEPLRTIGAAAREMLRAAAAQAWSLPATAIVVEKGKIRAEGKESTFGPMAELAAKMPVPKDPKLRPIDSHSLIGNSPPSLDLRDIVKGQANYGIDFGRPGQRIAVIARPPTVMGTIASLDDQAALAIPGVEKIVRIGPLGVRANIGESVAVIASNTWAALKGRDALKIVWKDGPRVGTRTMGEVLESAVEVEGEVLRESGSFASDWSKSKPAERMEMTFHTEFVPHLPMEPPACAVEVSDGRCEVWVHSQSPADAREEIAAWLGIAIEAVRVHVLWAGGAFGRKGQVDYIAEAVLAAKEAKVPLKVIWTREDEIRHGYYRPASVQKIASVVGRNGLPSAWRHRSAYGSIASTLRENALRPMTFESGMGHVSVPYAIKNLRVEAYAVESPLRIGWVRAVHHVHHALAVNCTIDELARRQGRDAIDFHLAALGRGKTREIGAADHWKKTVNLQRMRGVMELVRQTSGWGAVSRRGFAVHTSFGSYVAAVVEVSVKTDDDSKNSLRVTKVWVAVDCGRVLHPHHARGQVEGSVIFALSEAFYGQVAVEKGAVRSSNFDDIPVLRHAAAPEIIVDFVASQEAPDGLGEPVTPVIGPALLNAIAAQTGERITALPLSRRFRC